MTKTEGKNQYSDFSNVTNMRNQLIPEEFPEGSFGSPLNEEKPVQSKSSPWLKGQHRDSAYIYPDKEIHENLPRQAPGAHPLHEDSDEKHSK